MFKTLDAIAGVVVKSCNTVTALLGSVENLATATETVSRVANANADQFLAEEEHKLAMRKQELAELLKENKPVNL